MRSLGRLSYRGMLEILHKLMPYYITDYRLIHAKIYTFCLAVGREIPKISRKTQLQAMIGIFLLRMSFFS
jgi:hypothetical protein